MSGGNVPYHLRTNKAVDRQLFIELLAKINRFTPITRYSYIGFGGPFLEDFKLIHDVLGLQKLISLESNSEVYKRQKYNRPLGCINLMDKDSHWFVSNFEESEHDNVIVWLDYATASETRKQIEEFQMLLTKLKTFDVVKVTLNASPECLREKACVKENGTPETVLEANEKRLEVLNDRLGDLLPADTKPESMSANTLPRVLYKSLEIAASKAMAGKTRLMGEFFQPLSAFSYQDSAHQMLTVTGIVLPAEKRYDFFTTTELDTWEFSSCLWDKVMPIRLPFLSIREKMKIDRMLPNGSVEEIKQAIGYNLEKGTSATKSRLESYSKFYRYYPSFHRVSY